MSTEPARTCAYALADGTRCPCPAEPAGSLCFWHDPSQPKDGPDVRQRLEAWARGGGSMEGFVLRHANLEGLRLSGARTADLRHAVLFRACLRGASLWNANLCGADLMKADLSGANLNEARLLGANILGAVIDGAKLERTQWGDRAVQEGAAEQAAARGDAAAAHAAYVEAEEVYRGLRLAHGGAGRHEDAGVFFRREMTMRRKLMPRWSLGRMWSKLVDLCSGYGEAPERVVVSSLGVVLGCAAAYLLIGVRAPEGPLVFQSEAGVWANLAQFLNCVYFSFVTFTTVGFGDIVPTQAARPVAAAEAFLGAFMISLFVAVFARKMTR
ncbi:MAG: ion channel [Candidatus Latescibacterota bacterium]